MMSPVKASVSLFCFLALRYYRNFLQPDLRKFETYYVQQLALNKSLNKVRLTWANPKSPRVVTVPVERFKQIHYLDHMCYSKLSNDLVPFSTWEAGFDDNKFDSLYRTIYFQIASSNQAAFMRALSKDENVQRSLNH